MRLVLVVLCLVMGLLRHPARVQKDRLLVVVVVVLARVLPPLPVLVGLLRVVAPCVCLRLDLRRRGRVVPLVLVVFVLHVPFLVVSLCPCPLVVLMMLMLLVLVHLVLVQLEVQLEVVVLALLWLSLYFVLARVGLLSCSSVVHLDCRCAVVFLSCLRLLLVLVAGIQGIRM